MTSLPIICLGLGLALASGCGGEDGDGDDTRDAAAGDGDAGATADAGDAGTVAPDGGGGGGGDGALPVDPCAARTPVCPQATAPEQGETERIPRWSSVRQLSWVAAAAHMRGFMAGATTRGPA